MENIAQDDEFLEIVPLTERFDLRRGQINRWLARSGYQYRDGDREWKLTEISQKNQLGKRHAWAKVFAEGKGEKSGYNLKWRVSFIESHLDEIEDDL